MAIFPLAEDRTGLSPDNYHVSDPIAISSDQLHQGRRVIFPPHRPYFKNSNFKLIHISTAGVETELVEGVDYTHAFKFNEASYALKLEIFGGIVLLRESMDGYVRPQANYLGGPWVIDNLSSLELLEKAITRAYGSRSIYLEEIANFPTTFPPGPHGHPEDSVTGTDAIRQALADLNTTITDRGPTVSPATLTEYNNAIGLLLDNINQRMDALAGSDTDVGASIEAILAEIEQINSTVMRKGDINMSLSDFTTGGEGYSLVVPDAVDSVTIPDGSVLTVDRTWVLSKELPSGSYSLTSTGTNIAGFLGIRESDGQTIQDATWLIDTNDTVKLIYRKSTNTMYLRRG